MHSRLRFLIDFGLSVTTGIAITAIVGLCVLVLDEMVFPSNSMALGMVVPWACVLLWGAGTLLLAGSAFEPFSEFAYLGVRYRTWSFVSFLAGILFFVFPVLLYNLR
jgi:hypothetical protein